MLGRETGQLPHAKGKREIVCFKLFRVVPPVYDCSELEKVSPAKQKTDWSPPFSGSMKHFVFNWWKNRAKWTASGCNCKGREDHSSVRHVLPFLGSYDPLLAYLGEGRVCRSAATPARSAHCWHPGLSQPNSAEISSSLESSTAV